MTKPLVCSFVRDRFTINNDIVSFYFPLISWNVSRPKGDLFECASVVRCCSAAAKYKCCSAAVLRSEGSRDEGGGERQEEGQAVGSRQGKGKVCFGFLLLDDPCSSDYAQRQRSSSKSQANRSSARVDSGPKCAIHPWEG